MKKLFINKLPFILLTLIVGTFFLLPAINGKVPIPSDALIGLYHPWRDIELGGFNQGKYPVKNPLITDPILQTFPWRILVIDNLKALQLPLWNPYNFSGQPLLANIQSSVFNPYNLIFIFLPFVYAWPAQIALSLIVTSAFMYLFLRSLNLSKVASVLPSFVLPFSGFFVAWMTWGTVTITASFLPLILFSINKINEKLSATYVMILIFSTAFLFLSGHTQTAIYVLLVSFLYSAFKSSIDKKYSLFLLTSLCICLGVIVSSVQLIPSLEFLNLSNRTNDIEYFPQKEDWFLPLQHIAQLFVPDFFGNPTRANYWGIWNYGEFVSYSGIATLIFALFACFKKNKTILFFAGLLFLSFIIATKNPLSSLPYTLELPVLSSMQPSRIIFLLNFSLITLSAFGIDAFIKSRSLKINYGIIFIFISFVLLTFIAVNYKNNFSEFNATNIALKNMIVPFGVLVLLAIVINSFRFIYNFKLFILLTSAILVFDMFYFAYRYIPFSSLNTVFPQTRITDFLSAQEKPFRVMTTDRRIANPNSLSAYKIESVSGYDPLYLKKYADFIKNWQNPQSFNNDLAFNRFITPENYESPITNLMNVKYLLTFDEITKPGFNKVIEEGQTKLYLNENYKARIFPVSEVIRVNKHDDLSKLNLSDFSRVYSSEYEHKNGDTNSQITISEYKDQSIRVKVNAQRETPLYISNINYPGWKAFINSNEIPLREVNYIHQSVLVPPGENELFLAYKPGSFKLGLIISIIAIAISFMLSFSVWKKYQ